MPSTRAGYDEVPVTLTEKGGKIPLKCIYLYPKGHGSIVYQNGHQQVFDEEYEAIQILAGSIAKAKRVVKQAHKKPA